jgi:hypothetical protein
MKEKVKKILKSSSLGRVIYEPIHWCYRLYSVPRRRRVLRRNGILVLTRLSEIFERHQIPAFAAYGTLLGFVREGGFLKHDDDIDIGILPGPWSPRRLLEVLLEKESGFLFLWGFSYNGKVTEFKMQYRDVPIDFFFYEDDGEKFHAGSYHFYPNMKYPSPTANSAQRVCEPRIVNLSKIKVYGIDFPVPENTEFVLESLYGNWRVPDTKWDDSKHPGIEDLPGFAYSVTKEEVMNA